MTVYNPEDLFRMMRSRKRSAPMSKNMTSRFRQNVRRLVNQQTRKRPSKRIRTLTNTYRTPQRDRTSTLMRERLGLSKLIINLYSYLSGPNQYLLMSTPLFSAPYDLCTIATGDALIKEELIFLLL